MNMPELYFHGKFDFFHHLLIQSEALLQQEQTPMQIEHYCFRKGVFISPKQFILKHGVA